MKSVALHNLGCKVNSYEIEVMQQMLQEKGYTIVPVSYTHLRAHETRHDLVCRLLLEKKKENFGGSGSIPLDLAHLTAKT